MGRTILAPTTVAAALRARHTIVAVYLAALLALALTLAAPVAAQEETTAQTTNGTQTVSKGKDASGQREQSVQGSGQQAEDETQADDERTADPLEGQTVTIAADSIGPIAVAGCETVAGETASITVVDADGTPEEVFTDGEGVVFRFGQQGITITAEGGGDLEVDEDFDVGTGEVADSEGISCDNGNEQQVDEDGDNDGNEAGASENAGDEGCTNPRLVENFRGTENQRTAQFPITGENFRIRFMTEPVGQDPFLPTVEVDVLNENGRPIGEGFFVFEGEDGSENILAGPGNFRLEIRADEASYDITVEDCGVTGDDDGNGDNNIVNVPNDPLPNTGGPSLLALAVLGVVSAAAGLSVIRGSRR